MIGDIILAVFAILLALFYANVWWAFRKITKELDELSFKYSTANESIRDLESRSIFLEKHKQKQDKYNEWIESHPPIKPT